jgi:ABC-2 type transport system permease protein
LVGQVGYVFFREHAWGTWERLRATDLTRAEFIAGKTAVPLATFSDQFAILFGLGHLLFGLQVRGSVPALAVVGTVLALVLTAFGLALVAVCRSFMSLQTIVNIGALVFAGAGGGLVPFLLLPAGSGLLPRTPPGTGRWKDSPALSRDQQRQPTSWFRSAPCSGGQVPYRRCRLAKLRFEETKTGWA